MTVDEQLREMARRAEEAQRPITVEEIVARASGQDATRFLEPSGPTPAWRHRRYWLLAAAAVIVAVAAIGLLAIDPDDDSDSVRVVTDPPTTVAANPPVREVFDGVIAFAADSGAGEDLMDFVDYDRVEGTPLPMDIYLTRAGEPARRLVSSGAHERCPAFSPDGSRLAYVAFDVDPVHVQGGTLPEPPVDATLVVLRLDESPDPSDPELLVPFAAPDRRILEYARWCPQWSPDGSRLAYLAHHVGPVGVPESAELRVVGLDGQEQVVDLTGTPTFAWSPSGDAIAFLRDDGVWEATLDGRAPSLLWQPDGFPRAVSWSSRGELAVTVSTEVAGDVVHVVDADGGSEPLGSPNGCDFSASWSPDGTQIAFVGDDRQIVLHDRDDGSTVLLPPPVVDDHAVSFCDVAWSPSSEQLLALAHAMDSRFWDEDPDFVMSRGMALLALSTDGTLIDVLTPWSWAFDWTNLDDVSSYPSE